MLIDLHAHTSGISKCCKFNREQIVEATKAIGIGGMVLTNHYQKSYYYEHDNDSFVKMYVDEYYKTLDFANKMDFKVFFGIEVTTELFPNCHLLIYGVEVDFLDKHPLIFDYTLEEIYTATKQSGGILIQAHPYRNGATILDINYLDGVEINCHPKYQNTYKAKLIEIAKNAKKAVTCGGDFHADTYRPKCGIYLPDSIKTVKELSNYIINNNELEFCVQEPNTEIAEALKFVR